MSSYKAAIYKNIARVFINTSSMENWLKLNNNSLQYLVNHKLLTIYCFLGNCKQYLFNRYPAIQSNGQLKVASKLILRTPTWLYCLSFSLRFCGNVYNASFLLQFLKHVFSFKYTQYTLPCWGRDIKQIVTASWFDQGIVYRPTRCFNYLRLAQDSFV